MQNIKEVISEILDYFAFPNIFQSAYGFSPDRHMFGNAMMMMMIYFRQHKCDKSKHEKALIQSINSTATKLKSLTVRLG